jgi:tetratricopeptide (TPR) repeat protein
VQVRRETIVLPTFEPLRPDRNPMFLEKRVYQGSSGRVYPLPFTDRIADKPTPRGWQAVWLENEFIRLMILPQLGGRIHRAQDKTNGYDFIYYQPVIKPALVGLAGPWASGGIEFNWPQHHRPSTFMPADVAVEHHADGSVTVWLSEHDPMARMKGMHGVRLRPGSSCVEIAARVYNRTSDVQTFLWWSNIAARVHASYQSFFPPDVTFVADHARRAMSTFPICTGYYYGVDYARRSREGLSESEIPRKFAPAYCARSGGRSENGDLELGVSAPPIYEPNDLSWYANIPVPTSYMCLGSAGNFAGGYDHKAQAGFVHVADHHISPGKKQWTWGNHEFGYAWDRNLTAADEHGEYGPYIELMAGVYTDNQPDFSYLQPGESKSWSQFMYPIRGIGPVQEANAEAAVSLRATNGIARIGVVTTAVHPALTVVLERAGRTIGRWTQPVAPDRPFVIETPLARASDTTNCTLRARTESGRELIAYQPKKISPGKVPSSATEPPAPADVASPDELFVIGLHLEQYRHATRAPESYWREALKRDPGDSRCNLALGRWHLKRGELPAAETCFRTSIARLVSRNANPADGEPYYQLGLCLRHQAFAAALDSAKLDDAYAAFYKATWNQAWQAASFHALGEIDALRRNWSAALEHLERALRVNADNHRARDLKVIVLRRLARETEATALVRESLAIDPLDWWARLLDGDTLACDVQVRLDLALDHARAGLFHEALDLLNDSPAARSLNKHPESGVPPIDLPDASLGTGPLVQYYCAWLSDLAGDRKGARLRLRAAVKASPDFCFPARLEEIAILEHAIAANPRDARAPFYLGNLLYDRRRHREAIRMWKRSVVLEPSNAVAWRNLGIGYYNVIQNPIKARAAYDRAFRANPHDARLLYERDQLWKRLGEPPAKRLRELQRHPELVRLRDDLSLELCALFNRTGAPEKALAILANRKFQPWEGGEGQVLGQHVRIHLLLGRRALQAGDVAQAIQHFRDALAAPENLGESKHILANQSDIHYWLGRALAAAGETAGAHAQWTAAAGSQGDFQTMSVQPFSEMTYYSALALNCLGRSAAARKLFGDLLAHARALAKAPATLEFFATSLPTMLIFDDDLQARQRTRALFLEAQARLGLGQTAAARQLLRTVLHRDPSHALTADLLAEHSP